MAANPINIAKKILRAAAGCLFGAVNNKNPLRRLQVDVKIAIILFKV